MAGDFYISDCETALGSIDHVSLSPMLKDM